MALLTFNQMLHRAMDEFHLDPPNTPDERRKHLYGRVECDCEFGYFPPASWIDENDCWQASDELGYCPTCSQFWELTDVEGMPIVRKVAFFHAPFIKVIKH